MKKRALFMATAVLCLAGNIAAGQTKAETVSQEKQAYEYSKEDENGNTVNETKERRCLRRQGCRWQHRAP